jgi:hypothetical protein
LQPYGEYDQPETMDASYEQHDQWTAHRADYAARHGITLSELDMNEETLPHDCWDPRESGQKVGKPWSPKRIHLDAYATPVDLVSSLRR